METGPLERHTDVGGLFQTLDILDISITARDKDKAFEAVTVLLFQFLNAECVRP